ncbi:MAG: M20/M25/M40 family metallo-hydrolase [Terriglobia bacterium]|jgi:acetylornithine deacetylase
METITQLIDSWGPEIINFTKELIATPSETPTGDERSITQLIKARLNKLGLSGAEVASEVLEHPNIIYRLSGKGGGPTLLYVAHTDTKPVGDARELWATDPFTATIKDGKMYGLGAADMKAALSAFVYAAAALR